jgi:hypothetical protein
MPTRRPRQNDQRAKICVHLFDNRRNGHGRDIEFRHFRADDAGKRDCPSAGLLAPSVT